MRCDNCVKREYNIKILRGDIKFWKRFSLQNLKNFILIHISLIRLNDENEFEAMFMIKHTIWSPFCKNNHL